MRKTILFWRNMVFLLKNIAEIERLYIPLLFAKTLLASVMPLLVAFFPSIIIRNVQTGNIDTALQWIVAFFASASLLYAVLHKINACIGVKNQYIDGKMTEKMNLKAMGIRLEELNRRDIVNKIVFAKESLEKVELSRIITDIFNIVSAFNILAGTIYILSQIGVKMLIVFLVVLIINAVAEKRRLKQRKDFDEKHVEDRRNLDYNLELLGDSEMAKELRTFNLKEFLSMNFHTRYEQYEQAYHRTRIPRLMLYFVNFLCDAVRDFSIYAVITLDFIQKKIDIGSFYLYTAAAGQMYSALRSLSNALMNLNDKAEYIEYIRWFWNEQYEVQGGGGLSDGGVEEISFIHVNFRYKEQEKDVLKDINLTIKKGEKIGIVGANGAGKTTLVRLLLNMYAPASGKIIYKGTDISEIAQEEYLREFSAVFQKALILPETIRENIMVLEGGDDGRFINYEDVVLKDRVDTLPFGEETKLIRNLDTSAINFSGGEEQKLMILRALNREAQVYVLDEPVSALSPKAEYEIVGHLLEKLSDKTAVIISHRMGIIQKCSKIIVLKDGTIAEEGTHEELMEKKGLYEKMYTTQAAKYAQEMSVEEADPCVNIDI